MISSSDRILTTHTGSLPRPPRLTELVYARQEGKPVDPAEFQEAALDATKEVVRLQRQAGIDIVSDGEMNKPGFVNYIGQRLTGFGGLGDPVVACGHGRRPAARPGALRRPGRRCTS